MPEEKKVTKAEESDAEHLEEKAGVEESSTDVDEELDELLGQLHSGVPLEDEEVDEAGEDEGAKEEEEFDEGELTPSEQHSLSVATKKDTQIKALEEKLEQRDEEFGQLSSRQQRLEELILQRGAAAMAPGSVEVLPKQLTVEEQRANRAAAIVERIDPDGTLDFITTPKKEILSRIVGAISEEHDRRVQDWMGQNEDLRLMQETRGLGEIIQDSPSLTRFVQHPETTKQLRALRRDSVSLQADYADADKNRRKAMLLDVMTARADNTMKRAVTAREERRGNRPELQGAFSPKTSDRVRGRKVERESLKDRTAKMSDEEFGKWSAAAIRKAEAQEAEVRPEM